MRLTAREKEIVEMIKREPLISQEELAERLGIARSSVAVHISNLMKKGIILGKGYVFNERVSCVVIGDAFFVVNVEPWDTEGKNRAKIEVGMGGFGFLMSKSLARLGMDVKFLGLIGADQDGTRQIDAFRQAGVNVSQVYRPVKSRACWEVRCHLEKPKVFRQTFESKDYIEYLNSREWLSLQCEWLVVDPRYLPEMAEWLEKKAKEKEKVNLATCLLYEDFYLLPQEFTGFRLLVLGCEKVSEPVLERAGTFPIDAEMLVFTDGRSQVMVFDSQGITEVGFAPGQSFSLDGGLVDFTAGLIYGLSANYPLRQAVRIGLGLASINEQEEEA